MGTKKTKEEGQAISQDAITLEDGQVVTLAGKSYTMRRLSTKDVFKFAKILTKATKAATMAVGLDMKVTQETFGLVLMAGMAEEDQEIAGFYGGLIDMSSDEFLAQPPKFFNDFLDELPKHYDLAAFFTTALKATQAMGSLFKTQ